MAITVGKKNPFAGTIKGEGRCDYRIAAFKGKPGEEMLKRLKSWGLTGVLVKDQDELEEAKKQGLLPIRTFISPELKRKPFSSGYLQELEAKLSGIEGPFLWESPLFKEAHTAYLVKNHKLKVEILLEEVSILEKVGNGRLCIYSLPKKGEWTLKGRELQLLQDYLGPDMLLLFPAEKEGGEHPLWNVRGSKAIPFIKIDLPEAPLFVPEIIEKYLLREDGIALAGAVIEMPSQVGKSGFLEMHLHFATIALQKGLSPRALYPKWLASFHPEIDAVAISWVESLSAFYPRLDQLERAAKGEIPISSEEIRAEVDSLLILLRKEEKKLEKIEKEGPFWKEVSCYLRWAKDLARSTLDYFKLPVPHYLLSI